MIQKIAKPGLTNLDRDLFVKEAGRRPFTIGHNLSYHELFSLEKLSELSKSLPEDLVQCFPGNVPVGYNPNTYENASSASHLIEQMHKCNSRVVLKGVQNIPAYAKLLDDCLCQIEEYSDLVSQGMALEQCDIYISSPGAVTPFHFDAVHSFLLQVCGQKKVFSFNQDDRSVVGEQRIEEYINGEHRDFLYDDTNRFRAEEFSLKENEGLHLPAFAPHIVENGSEVSISFSITFETTASADRERLHRLNSKLRQFGWSPSEVADSSWRDKTKLTALEMIASVKRIVRSLGTKIASKWEQKKRSTALSVKRSISD